MNAKLLIIEDNLMLAEDLKLQLEDTGYEVVGIAGNRDEVFAQLSVAMPDLLIVDIELEDGQSGIDIVKEINQDRVLPVVYLTGMTNQRVVKSALSTNPSTYLVKPCNLDELIINIDLAMSKFMNSQPHFSMNEHKVVNDAIFVPDKQMHHRVNNADIYTVEADGSYIKIHTTERSYHLSSNLKNFMSQFHDPSFIRVSRKHLVNTRFIDKINGNMLYLGPHEIQISKEQRQQILNQFPILKTKKGN